MRRLFGSLLIVFLLLLVAIIAALLSDIAYHSAQAQEVVSGDSLKLQEVKLFGDKNYVRMILSFAANTKPLRMKFLPKVTSDNHNLTLSFPQPLQLELKQAIIWRSFIKGMSISNKQNELVFFTNSPFLIDFIKQMEIGQTPQIVISLRYKPTPSFVRDDKAFRVVIDAGHGGVDSGAIGYHNFYEKNITLDFAKRLKATLEEDPYLAVRLTREEDIFLKLSDRVEIARQWNANLFISIHADSIDMADLYGATVYTLSEEASDDIAQRLAESENNADILGENAENKPKAVQGILFDLLRRETHTLSFSFAEQLLKLLKQEKITLIKNPHRSADFQVLRAPDVPSVLIELGYLSNKNDEARLCDAKWRDKMAKIFARAIKAFAQQYRDFAKL